MPSFEDMVRNRQSQPPRPTAMFPHIGGPCDGVDMPVAVDADGVPEESNSVLSFTDPDNSIPSFMGIQSSQVTAQYLREEVLTDDGFGYVFRFFGEAVVDQNRPAA